MELTDRKEWSMRSIEPVSLEDDGEDTRNILHFFHEPKYDFGYQKYRVVKRRTT